MSAPAPPRALAVDALRGLAILGMVLVAVEPATVLPGWMYHAQTPPPSHEMNTALPGLTWPDLVFPFFIFTLGAAIPLALSRRLDAGERIGTVVAGALTRGLLLVFFALFRQHFDSSVSGLPPPSAWAAGLAAFAVLCLVFMRLPPHWSRSVRLALRAIGWAGAAAMFALVRFPDGSAFRPERIDIILLLLAYCALLGTLIWVATRRNLLARLAVLAAIASLRIAGYAPGWINEIYLFDPIPWLYKFSFFQFLCAVIPGTIAGDLLLEWSRAPRAADDPQPRATGRTWALAGVLALVVPVVLTGVQARYVFATTCAAVVLAAAARFLARQPATPTDVLVVRLLNWGMCWLLLGLLLDPFDGGTKKVPETFAWFFQGCGLALFVLALFIVLIDSLRRPRALQLFIDNGQNPMVAYVAVGMLITPVLGLTGLGDAVHARLSSPWMAFSWSVIVTLTVAFTVQAFTRRRWLWRS